MKILPTSISAAFLLLTISVFPNHTALAATDPIADFCATPQAQADAQARQECQALANSQGVVTKIGGEKDSIQNEIKIIDAEIQIALQKIKIQERIITQLSGDIKVKSKDVVDLQTRIDMQLKSIKALVQKVNERDSMSMPEVLLGNNQFSDFYTEVDAFYTLNKELTALIADIKSVKTETEGAKASLEDRKDKETDAKVAIEAQKRLIDRKKADKNVLLGIKNTELNAAQKILTDQKAKVAQIRSRLFKFQDGEGIPFGDAYDYAAKAAITTGVRPAFVLGILMQESGHDAAESTFGENVGACYVRDQTTGAGVGANTGTPKIRTMHPTRDLPVFMQIASALGFDWQNQRVSCWIAAYSGGQPYGWGGAMGAAQFIPSTWKLYQKRIGQAFGIPTDQANPWNPEHAIMAASLYLGDLGAGLQTYSAERNAACSYYSGKKCASSTDGTSYGNSVMRWVTKIQEEMINPILGQ